MKIKLIFLYIIVFAVSAYGQKPSKFELIGKVSFISVQYYYVAFDNTTGIQKGDTLYVKQGGVLIPCLIVEHLSGRSCAGKIFNDVKLSVDEIIVASVPIIAKIESENKTTIKETNEKSVGCGFRKTKKR